ncbi:MAG: hypothetical protein JSS63_02940 [Bacteroidetes bacterium]|nr:hypothetical protein [Bacteroidota bacterium]
MKKGILLALLFPISLCFSQPTSWSSKGIGGGGAIYAPSISPFNPNKVNIACDMSNYFYSYDFGTNFTAYHYQNILVFRNSIVRYTNDSNTCYNLRNIGGGYSPVKSIDGGMTWVNLVNPASSSSAFKCYDLYASPFRNDQIIVSDKYSLYISNNGGTNFSAAFFTAGATRGMHLAGVYFDDNNTDIYVCTNKGVLLSTNAGASFSAYQNIPGIDTTNYDIVSFEGSKQGSAIKFVCAAVSNNATPHIIESKSAPTFKNLYSINWGEPSWKSIKASLPDSSVDKPFFVRMVPNDTSTFYLGGTTTVAFNGSHAVQSVYKTTNGGANFTSVFLTASNVGNNGIFYTGWYGYSNDAQLYTHNWYGGSETAGICVDPNDKNRVIVTNSSAPHKTTDGGVTWTQAYVNPADQNNAGALVPSYKNYATNGLETTVCYNLMWADSLTQLASFADLLLVRSTDAGNKWHFAYKGFPNNQRINDVGMIIKSTFNGYLYACTGEILGSNGIWDDSMVDPTNRNGAISFSTDKGANWDTLFNFRSIVSSICFDPNNPKRMYASVMNYQGSVPPKSAGGIYVCNDVTILPAVFTPLSIPGRTQGHPVSIQALNDSSLIAVYTGRTRLNTFNFTDSSGVFYSTDGGSNWQDRTQTGMKYFTHSLTIDPYDVAQNTWLACTRQTNFLGSASQPGIWKTTNRGVNWTKIFDSSSVRVDFHPARANEMYISTESVGLYYAVNTNTSPSFTKQNQYPFRTPTGVFFNPYNSNEVWITSLGNGMRVGYTNYALPLTVTINAFLEGSFDGVNQSSDTLTLYIRSSSAPYTIIDSSKAIVSNLGVSNFSFTNTPAGSYYLSVKNRNMIETWSASPAAIVNGSNSYDFSASQSSAYGSNLFLKSGKWCFYNGDLNQDGFVNGNDFTVFSSQFGTNGYLVSDLNNDGFVNGNDFTSFSNSFGRQSLHP